DGHDDLLADRRGEEARLRGVRRQHVSFPTSSATESADFFSAACSCGVSFSSRIRSIPFAPRTTGTPTKSPWIPYSPSRYAAQGRIFFLSLKIASTISTAAAEGA